VAGVLTMLVVCRKTSPWYVALDKFTGPGNRDALPVYAVWRPVCRTLHHYCV
jgi:hypothetical protein